MTQLVNRDEIERRLARVIGREQRAALNELLKLLGNPPLLENVPPEYWETGFKQLASAIEPELVNIYMEQAQAFLSEIPIGVSWDAINTGASEYARTYGYDLVREIAQNTQNGVAEILRLLQEEIPAFYEEGLSLGELEARLSRWFGPVRAEMIAVTETTRAATEAERAVVEQIYSESGVRMIPYWNTENDELVCPICGPRDNKPITDGKFPPAHPRCRCWATHRMPETV